MKRSLTIGFTFTLMLLSALFLIAEAQAVVHPLTSIIDGAQANAGAGTGSPGTGSATMTFDDVSNEFSWDISWSGLLGTETAAHFHGPAFPNQNAGVQVGVSAISPSIGSTVITNAQATDLLNGLWYINIHTDQFPGGEIRGQVLPEPTTLLMFGGAAALVTLRRRRCLAD